MNIFWLILIFFWIIIIYNPELIAILIWIFFIIIWANIFLLNAIFKKGRESVRFGKYELFINKDKK